MFETNLYLFLFFTVFEFDAGGAGERRAVVFPSSSVRQPQTTVYNPRQISSAQARVDLADQEGDLGELQRSYSEPRQAARHAAGSGHQ